MAEFSYLFTPIKVGTMTAPNRIVETTNSIWAGRVDGLPDAVFTEHHLQKARGGVGWIGSETWFLANPIPPGWGDEMSMAHASMRHSVF